METTRDLGQIELWQASLERSLARRGKLPRSSVELYRLQPERDLAAPDLFLESTAYWQTRRQAATSRPAILRPAVGLGGISALALISATTLPTLLGGSTHGDNQHRALAALAPSTLLGNGQVPSTKAAAVTPARRPAAKPTVAPQPKPTTQTITQHQTEPTTPTVHATKPRPAPQPRLAPKPHVAPHHASAPTTASAAKPATPAQHATPKPAKHHTATAPTPSTRHTATPPKPSAPKPVAPKPASTHKPSAPKPASTHKPSAPKPASTHKPSAPKPPPAHKHRPPKPKPKPKPHPTYVNPLAHASVTPERIDQGVDYAGTGTLTSIGKARVTYVAVSGSGWPGAFIEYQLLDGSYAGRYVYYAEGVRPASGIYVGRTLNPGQPVATLIPGWSTGIEIGWGAGIGSESLAAERGDWTPYDGSHNIPSPEGASFSALIASLGGPPGR